MATLATFIGIDRHRDPRVRDLNGARRDALALWALFSDTVPDLRASHLLNAVATLDGVREVIRQRIADAGPDDTVIVSFAGHGTRDHRLVVHDTDRDRLTETTIPMQELAEAFRRCRAKALLCILDCCFSGGAPARVLEDSPTPRDATNPLEALTGNGRILLAAANVNERAYEHPTRRHGLLTCALIDVLREAEEALGIGVVTDRVLDRVRAEAARLGITQTPIHLGTVQGGLTLPPLQAGEQFRREFPELHGVTVSAAVADLAIFGMPAPVLAEWASRFAGGLNSLQLEAVNEFRVLEGASLLVVAPTSSGKTFIGEMAGLRAVIESRKAVFLFPYRALVNEKFDEFAALYGDRLGMRVVRCTGDYTDQTPLLLRGKYDIALLTYEMFLNLAATNPAVLNSVGLVVVDEAQFITDPNRGITVELLLTSLLASRERGICPQLLALSAVIGDVNGFDEWLGCRRLLTDRRPVPLIEGVLDRTGTFQYLDAGGQEKTELLLPSGSIRVRRDKASVQDVIVPLVRQLVGQGEKVLVFRNQRGKARGCAAYLAADLALEPARDALAALPRHDLSSDSAALRTCLQGGTAFHSTDLTREEREVVEREFRRADGPVRVLGATTTVAAGINTPADTVILAEQEFVGEDGRVFTVAEYKNMAGRAGRLGLRPQGRSVILAETSLQRQQLFDRYVRGALDPLRSSFDPEHLETWLVRLLAQVERVPRRQAAGLLASSFGGFLACKRSPGWRAQTEHTLEELLGRMIGLGLVEEEREFVRLTLLGRACGNSALSFDSAMRLVELLRGIDPQQLTPMRLMALLQVLPESDNGYTPLMRRGTKENVWPGEAGRRYGHDTVRLLQRFVRDQFEYLGRCKRSALLWDWVAGVPIDQIEQRYTATPYQGRVGHGDVRRFADATRFHLRSAHQIAAVMYIERAGSEEEVDRLLRQLEFGIPAELLGLLQLPLLLTRGEYLALGAAEARSPEHVWGLARERLVEVFGNERAAEIDAARPRP
jgi:replicative superfamily II helicase